MKEKAKYLVVEDYIKELIYEGALQIGDQLETEYQLANKFNVSRLTVNKAISRLAAEGIIERIPGKGSFVKQPVYFADYKTVDSFRHYISSQNKVSGSRLIEYKLYEASEIPLVAGFLELKPHDKVHFFVRVRTVDNEAIAMMTSYIPAKLVPTFDVSVLSGSLYDYFDSLNLPRVTTKSKLTAISADQYLAQNLEIDINTALLKHDHVVYTTNKIPLEYCIALYIGNKYAYEIKETRISQDIA